MRWQQLDPDEAQGMVWLRHDGPYTLQVFGDERMWGYTIARDRIIVDCVAIAAESPERARELADDAFGAQPLNVPAPE
jgi:hypothetical protein